MRLQAVPGRNQVARGSQEHWVESTLFQARLRFVTGMLVAVVVIMAMMVVVIVGMVVMGMIMGMIVMMVVRSRRDEGLLVVDRLQQLLDRHLFLRRTGLGEDVVDHLVLEDGRP